MRLWVPAIVLLACACAGPGRPRSDPNSAKAHAQLLEKRAQGKISAYFLGDSITRRWGATDYPAFLAHWKASFHGWNAANFGWGGDKIENMLWRVENGELDGVEPKLVVLLAGTNNLGAEAPAEGPQKRARAVLEGLKALRRAIRTRAPGAVILQMGIFPRNDNPAAGAMITQVNQGLAALAPQEGFRYLEINRELGDGAGKLKADYSADGLHLNIEGYEIWARALKPLFTEILGPPSPQDLAPPPTGDPSAAR